VKREKRCFGHYNDLWRGCNICKLRDECLDVMLERVLGDE
jgi:hypothetical protein